MYGTRDAEAIGTSLARASRKLGFELGRSSRNLFHDKNRETSGLTHGDDFAVTGTKGSLLELKKLESVYQIKASIIGAGSTKSIKVGERNEYCTTRSSTR